MTAARAQEGTAIASHAIGDICRQGSTAGALRAILGDYNTTGTSASRALAGFAGRFYKPTDSPVSYLDDGTNWRTIHRDTLLPYGPVTASNFTATHFQSGAATTQLADTVRFVAQGQNADSHQYLLKSLATPAGFTIRAAGWRARLSPTGPVSGARLAAGR